MSTIRMTLSSGVCAMGMLLASGAPALAAESAPNNALNLEGLVFPTRMIPNIPDAAEVYYATDNYHMIGQTRDPAAVKSLRGGKWRPHLYIH